MPFVPNSFLLLVWLILLTLFDVRQLDAQNHGNTLREKRGIQEQGRGLLQPRPKEALAEEVEERPNLSMQTRMRVLLLSLVDTLSIPCRVQMHGKVP